MEKWLRQIAEAEGFQWDKGNDTKNWNKHQVNCKEAEQVFHNSPLLHDNPSHSQKEKRFIALGETDEGRLLTISYTIRGKWIRVISARAMHRKERKIYETQK